MHKQTRKEQYLKTLIIFSAPLPPPPPLFSDPEFSLGIREKNLLEDVTVSETDINLEISFAEQAANIQDDSIDKLCGGKEDDTLLPVGVSYMLL